MKVWDTDKYVHACVYAFVHFGISCEWIPCFRGAGMWSSSPLFTFYIDVSLRNVNVQVEHEN